MSSQDKNNNLICFHCGDFCPDDSIRIDEKLFCCNGCKTVYEMLNDSGLCDYYELEQNPGSAPKKPVARNKYDFLKDKDLQNSLIEFKDENLSSTTLKIPSVHCSSCIWLLENLYRLHPAIKNSRADFVKKTVNIKFDHKNISLRQVVELLDSIGYDPELTLEADKNIIETKVNRKLWYELGIAGFCFGNIMLLSFPDYLSLDQGDFENYKYTFAWINFFLSLPVILFSASEYYLSAFKGLKGKYVNIDVPITLGIIALFLRSTLEIITQSGQGYFDSLTGLIFLLLIGKLFQNKTYARLNFERNYKSYFPVSVTVNNGSEETTIPVAKLEVGQRIVIRNNELIPADSVLMTGSGNIDYSFVTGESELHSRKIGEVIYAGGRHFGNVLELEVVKSISQSYLTQLWNDSAFSKRNESRITKSVNIVSKYFTFIILAIATGSALYWAGLNPGLAWNAFTAVLIIACPCALALATPFTLGTTMRIFGRNQFYLKNINVVEELSKINHIVFDKTGTLTETGEMAVSYEGKLLSLNEKAAVASLTRNSSHPLSASIYSSLDQSNLKIVENFDELPGKGLKGMVEGVEIKIGSGPFVQSLKSINSSVAVDHSQIFLSMNNKIAGYFSVKNIYRKGFDEVISSLGKNYDLSLLSGDNDSERTKLEKFFPFSGNLYFNQTPQDKLEYVRNIQAQSKNNVLMIGDGLNDAGALQQSDVGIAISEEVNNFSPACDAILGAASFKKLNTFLDFSKIAMKIITLSFVVSFIYNIAGLGFAVTGTLSPLIAAVLMPLSSITVVTLTTTLVKYFAYRKGLS